MASLAHTPEQAAGTPPRLAFASPNCSNRSQPEPRTRPPLHLAVAQPLPPPAWPRPGPQLSRGRCAIHGRHGAAVTYGMRHVSLVVASPPISSWTLWPPHVDLQGKRLVAWEAPDQAMVVPDLASASARARSSPSARRLGHGLQRGWGRRTVGKKRGERPRRRRPCGRPDFRRRGSLSGGVGVAEEELPFRPSRGRRERPWFFLFFPCLYPIAPNSMHEGSVVSRSETRRKQAHADTQIGRAHV